MKHRDAGMFRSSQQFHDSAFSTARVNAHHPSLALTAFSEGRTEDGLLHGK
jgi:hypothetical protein